MNAEETAVIKDTIAGLRVMSESAQWDIDRKVCTHAISLIESLQSQLSESRRRETAAEWVAGGVCSSCGGFAPSYIDGVKNRTRFCPDCGAHMRGPQDKGEEEK